MRKISYPTVHLRCAQLHIGCLLIVGSLFVASCIRAEEKASDPNTGAFDQAQGKSELQLQGEEKASGPKNGPELHGAATITASLGEQENPNRPPWAQKGKNTSPTKPTSPPTDDSEDTPPQRGRIKVNVNLVNVLTSVLDEHNRPAADLPREAFHLYEEGVEQKIEVFEPETQLPLDLALMIDASLSAHKEINFEEEAAARFIRQVLRPSDRLAVYAIGEDITRVADFSDDVANLQAAVHHIPAGGGTSIYDAIQLASRSLSHRGDDRRRVIILVTDAGETTSISDFDSARREAVRSGSLLYTIVVRPVKNESGRNTAGEHALQTITDTMGGAMFFPDQIQELDGIFEKINRELRTQYRLGYYPNPRGPANTYRSIEVKVDGAAHYQVRHRKSYLTGPQ